MRQGSTLGHWAKIDHSRCQLGCFGQKPIGGPETTKPNRRAADYSSQRSPRKAHTCRPEPTAFESRRPNARKRRRPPGTSKPSECFWKRPAIGAKWRHKLSGGAWVVKQRPFGFPWHAIRGTDIANSFFDPCYVPEPSRVLAAADDDVFTSIQTPSSFRRSLPWLICTETGELS